MSDDQGEFRKLAEESRQEAEHATTERDKAHWLKVSEMWTKLAISGSLFGVAEIETAQQPAPRQMRFKTLAAVRN